MVLPDSYGFRINNIRWCSFTKNIASQFCSRDLRPSNTHSPLILCNGIYTEYLQSCPSIVPFRKRFWKIQESDDFITRTDSTEPWISFDLCLVILIWFLLYWFVGRKIWNMKLVQLCLTRWNQCSFFHRSKTFGDYCQHTWKRPAREKLYITGKWQ